MRIFVSGPYSADSHYQRQANVDRAKEAGLAVLSRGHYPVIPHLLHYFDLWLTDNGSESLPYETYLAWDLDLLSVCDGLLCIGSSPGADRERAFAVERGIPVYDNVDDLPKPIPVVAGPRIDWDAAIQRTADRLVREGAFG